MKKNGIWEDYLLAYQKDFYEMSYFYLGFPIN